MVTCKTIELIKVDVALMIRINTMIEHRALTSKRYHTDNLPTTVFFLELEFGLLCVIYLLYTCNVVSMLSFNLVF